MKAGRFTFEPARCTGCQACVLACGMENAARQGRPWREVHTYNPRRHPDLPVFHLSLACHHCEDPACLASCPASAYARDPHTGAVLQDPARCMGCRYCTWACPHDAPKFNPATGTVEKCTACADRLRRGEEPACAARCPVEALGWEAPGDGDPGPLPPGVPVTRLGPSIRFGAPRPRPELDPGADREGLRRALDRLLRLPNSKITLRGEWSLLVFTSCLTALVAWQAASLRGGPRLPAAVVLGVGGAILALSAGHLGRRDRAWRAVLNPFTSWLSREILLVPAFLGLAALGALLPGLGLLGPAAALAGFGALLAVDLLYMKALGAGLHSAQVLPSGLYLAGLLAGAWPLALLAGLPKAAHYLHRRHGRWRQGLGLGPLPATLRLLLGFVVPFLLPPPLAACAALLGDLLDRAEFYDELEVLTPARELASQGRRAAGLPPR